MVSFKKAKSLLDTIIKMVESDEYCINIMQQNLAAIGLLRSAHQDLMQNHLNSCFRSAMESSSPAKKQKMIKEIQSVIKLYQK